MQENQQESFYGSQNEKGQEAKEMLYTEKEMKDTLGKEIQISETVEKRMQDTYKMLEERRQTGGTDQHTRRHVRFGKGAVAAAAAAVIGLSGTTGAAAYLAAHTDLIAHVFGDRGRVSKEAFETTVPDGKGGEVTVTMPAEEYVAAEEAMSKELTEPYAEDLNIVREIGDYKLTLLSNVTDGNAGCLSYKLECENGVRAVTADEHANAAKGALFTEDRDFHFCLTDAEGNVCAKKTIIDPEKSTDDCYYLYDSYVCKEETKNLLFHLERYDRPVSEQTDGAEKVMEEDIPLAEKRMPLTVVENPDNGKAQFAYSAISLSLYLSNGFGLDDCVEEMDGAKFVDPYYVNYIGIVYQDGTVYTVLDDKHAVNNMNYICGGMGEERDELKLVFNRMTDWAQVEKLVVNETEFLIGQR